MNRPGPESTNPSTKLRNRWPRRSPTRLKRSGSGAASSSFFVRLSARSSVWCRSVPAFGRISTPWPSARGGGGFIKVTTLDAIPADGTPAKFAVVADKVDAWNRFTNVSIGAVYLRLVDGVPKALHTICPHLGCFIDYRPGNNDFFCPCHNSNFKLDGVLCRGREPARDGSVAN